MGITIKTQPNDFSTAYSAIPLRVLSDNTESEGLKYLINVIYDESTYGTSTPVAFESQVYTNITTLADHSYKVGDLVLFYNPNTPSYTGIYTIKAIPSTDEFIIDLVQEEPIDNTTASYFYKLIPYSMLPDLEYEAKLDLSNTIKDFVSQDFTSTSEIYEAPSTFFEYGLTIGTEFKYVFEFLDNMFITGGTVAFINPSLTSGDVADSPFKVGDQITIQQNLFEWVYDDNVSVTGNLGFESATIDHNFEVGDVVNITGQSTHPSYNGVTTVIEVPTSKQIVVNKAFIGATGVEPGSCFGTPVPEYNTLANVTDIYWDATYGYVLETDLTYLAATPEIGGTIKFADGRRSQLYIEEKIDDLKAYNSHYTNFEYGFSNGDFDPYVVQVRTFLDNYFSTILHGLGKNTNIRIEQSTKSYLLVHSDTIGTRVDPMFLFYDADSNLLSQILLNNYQNFDDYYFPVGIDDILSNSNQTLINGSALATVLDDISYYYVVLSRALATYSNELRFELNKDCSSFDIYHLCWKDAFGSWLSYPFKYIETDSTEFERKEYYQKAGRFDLITNNFGYDTEGRGDTTFFNRSRDKMKLTSGWVTEGENTIIKDLLGSSLVMVQLPSGTMIGATIENKSVEFPRLETDYLWNYQLDVRLSTNDVRF